MKKNQSGKNSNLYSNDITKDINRAAYRKNQYTISVCDAWRKYQKENPTTTKTFAQFRKEYKNVRSN